MQQFLKGKLKIPFIRFFLARRKKMFKDAGVNKRIFIAKRSL